jgi:signal transduction histidine kinase/ligand-binding sensor domain-containing protein
MRRVCVLLVLLVVLTPPALRAQAGIGPGGAKVLAPGFSARVWTVEQGLPQSTVTELVTDADGYLWGATFGGVFRFDGRAIQSYSASEPPHLVSNAVTALASHDQDLWVGNPGGTIARVRNGRVLDSLPHLPRDQGARTIDALLADRPGEVWVREAGAVHRLVQGRWGARLPYEANSTLVRDRQGAVYFLAAQGLVRVTPVGDVRLVATPDRGTLDGEYGLHIDADDRIWLGTGTGLWRYANGVLERVARADRPVQAIVTDSLGDVWYAAGQRLFHRASRLPVGSEAGARLVLDAGRTILALAILHDGVLAVGTLDGLLVVRRNPTRLVSGGLGGTTAEAGSMAALPGGPLLVTSGCALRRIDPMATVVQESGIGQLPGCVRSLMVDRRGALWIGSDGALRRTTRAGRAPGIAGRRDTTFAIRSYLNSSQETVQPLLEAGDTVLFGLSDGRIGRVLPNDSLDFLPGWSVPTDVPVHSLARAGDGALWVGQLGMVSRQRGDSLTHFHALHGIPSALPRALLPDERGGVFIGTYGSGLWHLRPGVRARAIPLPDRTVSALLLDDDARLWMPGNRGLTVVAVTELHRFLADSTAIPAARLLSFADGVPDGNNGRPAATRVAPGVLAFATVGGVVEVRATDVLTTGVTPPVRIDSVRSGTGALLDVNGTVRIVPADRTVQLGFSVPSFSYPEAVRFRYRLTGRDSAWISLAGSRELRLVGLTPGRYTLLLEARAPGDAWRSATPWHFEVVPLFSERLWPRVVVASAILLLTLLMVRQRERTAKATARARAIELQAHRAAAELAERHQRELAQMSRVAVAGELTASLSHELGQPLAAIVNNAEVARRLLARRGASADAASPAVEQALLDVVAQGRRASEVVREFRRFLRREQGVRDTLAVAELIDSCTVLLGQEYAGHRVQLDVDVAPGTPPVHGERVLLQQVLVNLLQNACEAARNQVAGRVLVRARPVADGVRLSVADNGDGFAADVRRSAFEPFVTTRATGMGMGLAIARRVVEAHGGHIGLGQLPHGGGVVSLWLPSRPVPVGASGRPLPLQVSHG